jgi:hypothetical protein
MWDKGQPLRLTVLAPLECRCTTGTRVFLCPTTKSPCSLPRTVSFYLQQKFALKCHAGVQAGVLMSSTLTVLSPSPL